MTAKRPAPISSSVSLRLAEAREAARYVTALEFAEKNGIPYPTYYAHEVGSRIPNLDTIARYAGMMGVNKYWLAFGDAPMHLTAPDTNPRAAVYAAVERIEIKDLDLVEALLQRFHTDGQPDD